MDPIPYVLPLQQRPPDLLLLPFHGLSPPSTLTFDMGCVQSNAREESHSFPPEKGKSMHATRKERQKEKRELKKAGKWPPSPVVDDPAPWNQGHKTLVLKDGQALFVQRDTPADRWKKSDQ